MKTIILAAVALALSASMAAAQEPATKQTFLYLSPSDAMAKITASKGGMSVNFTPQNKNLDFFEIINRTKTGLTETHMKSANYTTIISGEATFILGGTVPDAKEVSPGEWQGTKIVGGKPYALKAGTIVVVPAGMPTWYNIPAGGHLLYTVVKHPDTVK